MKWEKFREIDGCIDPAPKVDEFVLVSNGVEIWIDQWVDYGYGCGLEHERDEVEQGLYWMGLPKLPTGDV